MRHVSKTQIGALDWLFDRINSDPKIQIKYIDTKKQFAEMLTKGNSKRDEWNLLCVCVETSHPDWSWLILPMVLQSCCTMTVRVRIITSTDVCRTLVVKVPEKKRTCLDSASTWWRSTMDPKIASRSEPPNRLRTLMFHKVSRKRSKCSRWRSRFLMSLCWRRWSSWRNCRRPYPKTESSSGLSKVLPTFQFSKSWRDWRTSPGFSKDKVEQRYGEEIIESPGVSLAENIIEMLVTQFMVLTVQKSKEISQLRHCDEVIDVPVVLVVRILQLRVVEQTAEIPQLQIIDKMTDAL